MLPFLISHFIGSCVYILSIIIMASKLIIKTRQDIDTILKSNAHLELKTSPTKSNEGLNQWIQLNVGGTKFTTTRMTLCKDPKSFLYRLVQDDHVLSSTKVVFDASSNINY